MTACAGNKVKSEGQCPGSAEQFQTNLTGLLASSNDSKAADLIETNQCQYGQKNDVLYNLDLAATRHYQGVYAKSDENFDKAERRMEELYTKSITQMAGLLVLNDATMDYAGEPHERVFLNIFRALNFVAMGKPAEAVVESRKVESFLEELNRHLGGKEVYKDDAFARYLDSLLYEDMGKVDDARISREAAMGAYKWYEKDYHTPSPRFPLAQPAAGVGELVFIHFNGRAPQKASKTIQVGLNKAIGISLQAITPDDSGKFKAALNALNINVAGINLQVESEVNVDDFNATAAIAANAAKGDVITFALPFYVQTSPAIANSNVIVDGKESGSTVLMEDVSAIATKALHDRINLILARAIARGTIKYIIAKAAADQAVKLCDRLPIGKDMCRKKAREAIMGLAALTESTDTRAWTTLPAQVRMARVSMAPGKHHVQIQWVDSAGAAIGSYDFPEVEIAAGKRTYLELHTGGANAGSVSAAGAVSAPTGEQTAGVATPAAAGGKYQETVAARQEGAPVTSHQPEPSKAPSSNAAETPPMKKAAEEKEVSEEGERVMKKPFDKGSFNLDLNYPGIGVRYFFADKTAVEGRAQYDGNNLAGGVRLYRYLAILGADSRFNPYLGAEGDYVAFKGGSSKGSGSSAAVFAGIEYALARSFSMQLDAGGAYLSLKDTATSLTQSGIGFVLNLGVNFYPRFGRNTDEK